MAQPPIPLLPNGPAQIDQVPADPPRKKGHFHRKAGTAPPTVALLAFTLPCLLGSTEELAVMVARSLQELF